MLAFAIPLMVAACDLGKEFSTPEAWTRPAAEFVAAHSDDGFKFASQKRDIANCMERGACTWHGLEVWEARIYYGDSGATRVEMSLYNRGDATQSDTLNAAKLKSLLDDIAGKAQPGGKIGSNPEHKKLDNDGFLFSKRWNRSEGDVELAWGVNSLKAKEQTAEFVRVTMHAKGAAKQRSSTRLGTGVVSKAKARANVRKNAEGDVWIDGVPMVDQGKKGYCAAATSERVLRYYGFAIDEHEIAQAAGTTAQGGTSVDEMKEAVRNVGSKCRLGFNDIVSMTGSLKNIEKDIEQYNRFAKKEGARTIATRDLMRGGAFSVPDMRKAMKPEIVLKMRMKDSRYRKFLSGVKSQVDQGMPVFWGVTLGMFPEPDIPQANGGHMRLIIGYNAKKHEVLYSDSWGAGHELKRMPEDKAFAITHDAFFLRPL